MSLLEGNRAEVGRMTSALKNHYSRPAAAFLLGVAAWIGKIPGMTACVFPILAWMLDKRVWQAYRLVCRVETAATVSRVLRDLETSGRPVVIAGAGTHTALLLKWTELRRAGIAFILDNDPANRGRNMFGIPVRSVRDVSTAEIGTIIVSSPDIPDDAVSPLLQGDSRHRPVLVRWFPSDKPSVPARAASVTPRLDEDVPLPQPTIDIPLIVYQCRHAEGTAPMIRFIEHYRTMDEPMPHDLLIVFTGFPGHTGSAVHSRTLDGVRHLRMDIDDCPHDIACYLAAYRRFRYPVYLFLNAFCYFRSSGCLTRMCRCLSDAPAAGIVSATGSWESGVRQVFPNPHARTSSFMLTDEVLRRVRVGRLPTKSDALEFEHGEEGLTRQILRMGLEPYVVGRDGRYFRKEEWPSSATFFSGGHSNLLISDNQTDAYEDIDPVMKAVYEKNVWG